jgi:hypothetical protein
MLAPMLSLAGGMLSNISDKDLLDVLLRARDAIDELIGEDECKSFGTELMLKTQTTAGIG